MENIETNVSFEFEISTALLSLESIHNLLKITNR